MVFGNKGETSATGVAFSRDEVTGAPEPSGDFLVNAQGEDVVSGVRTPRDLRELADVMPDVQTKLMEILRTLEAHYKDMQDVEFTVEEGRLYMLQTRNAKRPAQAAVRFAVDAVREGLLERKEALVTVDTHARELRINSHVFHEGDAIGVDGTEGAVVEDGAPLVEPQIDENFETLLTWADELRRLRVRANADTPRDATRARELGAEGIGLCRTEHMFMAADRQPKMRAMIMASDGPGRREALRELLPLQEADFKGVFDAMRGLPVTIRLLDPPLHEFLPDLPELRAQVERARIEELEELPELERVLERVEEIHEGNPMLGTRGCRLGILYPEIYEMQVEAIVRGAQAVDEPPHPEIMIPLVAYEHELEILRELVVRVASEHGLEEQRDYTVGTMIELPRACFVADRIARHADFFSFGTNDLTQTAIGFSRDDVESKFMPTYIERKIVDRSPFETIDGPGVGWLVRLGAWVGREAHPGLKLGICGEHGGDPESIAFFHMAVLDYVSCSPLRLPAARTP